GQEGGDVVAHDGGQIGGRGDALDPARGRLPHQRLAPHLLVVCARVGDNLVGRSEVELVAVRLDRIPQQLGLGGEHVELAVHDLNVGRVVEEAGLHGGAKVFAA